MTEQNKKAAAALESMFEHYKTPCQVVDIISNNFSTLYQLEPCQGVKVNKIKSLLPDLSIYFDNPQIIINEGLYLKVDTKNAQRIFYDFFKYADKDTSKRIPLYLGVDEKNQKICLDLSKLPHLLVSGSTGSGKSVFLHDLILSLLSENNQLLMIDPKRVELSIYKGVKGVNVLTDTDDILRGLQSAVDLMYSRYSIMENQGIVDGHGHFDPYIIIIDELSDLMLNKEIKKQVETSICRIAQMGRAAAVHVIIATQRPSVNVLTGLIKANIPARVVFSCASAVDSRCIINQKGAERLKGLGDGYIMLSDTDNLTRFQAYSNNTTDILNFIKPIMTPTRTQRPTQRPKKLGLFARLLA